MGQGISPFDLKSNQLCHQIYSQKQEFVAYMSLNGMLSSKRSRKVALHTVYGDPFNKDNDSESVDREKNNNSLRLVSGIHPVKIMTVQRMT